MLPCMSRQNLNLTQLNNLINKGATMKTINLNQQALKLAHQLKPAYSSFRAALLVAYKVLRSYIDKLAIMAAMVRVSNRLYELEQLDKYFAVNRAWAVLFTLA